LIVDVPVSAVGLTVQQVANDRKKLFITHSTGTADFHGKFRSPYTMQWVFDTHTLAVGTAQQVVKRGGNTWFFPHRRLCFRPFVGARCHAGHRPERRQGDRFGRPSVYHAGFVLIHSSGAVSKGKIIGLASGPPDNVDAIKLVGESGIFTGGQQMAGLLVLITDVHALGLKAAQGLLLTTSFDCDMDDKTREWSKRFFAKIDRIPTMWQAGVLFVGDPLSQGDPSHRHRRSA